MTKIEIIIIAIIVILLGFLGFISLHRCKVSHFEVQYQTPPSVVVGGGKYGGGTAIPIGNIRPVNVEVCDEW